MNAAPNLAKEGSDTYKKVSALNPNSDKDTIGWLYNALNILDAKANSLLRVNSMFITLLGIFWALARAADNPLKITQFQIGLAIVAAAFVIVSVMFCFAIVRVDWKFLGMVAADGSKDSYDFKSEAKRLAEVVDSRTHYYWLAWGLTLLVVVVLATGCFSPAFI